MAESWEGWHCYACKERIAEGDVQLSYLQFRKPARGPRCPKCGAVFVSEELGKRLRKVEEQIEDK